MTWTLCTSTTPVARKPHLCRQCHTTIEIGTRHECASGIYDGEAETIREHSECARAVRSLIRLRGEREDDYENNWPILSDEDLEEGEIDWLRERYPVVASRLGMGGTVNPSLRSALEATLAPVGFSIPTIADLRGIDAVLVVQAHWWLRSRRTAGWLRLPVADMDGLDAADRVRVVEDALDRLDALPALHAHIPPIRHL